MATCIALLRGVNVGGHRKITMADLCRFITDVGYGRPRSIGQSGNLAFEAIGEAGAIERRLETEAASRLRMETTFFVRRGAEWGRILSRNPFKREAEADPAHLVVMFLKDAPAAAKVKALQAVIRGPEVIVADGRQLYITYPVDIGHSRLTGAVMERALGTRMTGRNWNTVVKLGALARA
jgi:uncharacterized protein (DUF1697 family)